MLPDYSLLAWALIVFSTYLTGISKGGFAGGFGGPASTNDYSIG